MIHDLTLFYFQTDDVDTRAITRRLREDGSLIGALSTDSTKTDEELLDAAKTWEIVGKGCCSIEARISS